LISGYKKLFAYFAQDIAGGRLDRLQAICRRFDYAGRFLGRIMINSTVTRRCSAAYGTLSIRNNGDAYPCDTYAGWQKNKIGNIYEDLHWDKNFIPTADELESCRACGYRYLCGGPCRVWQDLNDGDTALECALNKAVITECFRLAALLEKYPAEKNRLNNYFRYYL